MAPHLILLGGFLGAGKTTLALTSAQRLISRGFYVGLITNDQGSELVDTALLRQAPLAVAEVGGGCFCCRYPDLLKALDEMVCQVSPDVIFAEAVGSCTDILSTVIRPLLAQRASTYHIAPLTVAYDPLRNIERFSGEVHYLFHQQLHEAEVLVLTKQDVPAAAKTRETFQVLAERYGVDKIFPLSAVTGEGVDAWLDCVLTSTTGAAKRLDVDYATYAAGEAALGWLNAVGELTSNQKFSPCNWATHLLHMMDDALSAHNAPIAHLKIYFRTENDESYKASLIESGGSVRWDSKSTGQNASRLTFVFNARVQSSPVLLENVVRHVFAELSPFPEFAYKFTRFECFHPSAPQPTHRM
ncbi:GTP-binding protein [Caldilinea sp.]|uniref:GTP-binding protein n=1 Tax=Caldilinea sp. TaxID=2293560 RepID=UPI0021DDE202|nr:GTP-binding protein [Caldilinea sp.]GIV70397.1 MAG: cobalamin synthesis protein P47K [Caldilinea sp.]